MSETEAQELYDDFYVQRGATSEHRIKEFKLGLNADRLSCPFTQDIFLIAQRLSSGQQLIFS